MKRNREIDILKGFAISAIVLWHFHFLKTEFFVFAIPLFIFVTAVLFGSRWEKFSARKMLRKLFPVVSFVIVFSLISFFLKIPPSDTALLDEKNPITFFFLRNPWLGNLWYLLLYAQILFTFFLIKNFFQKFPPTFNFFKNPKFGIFIFFVTQAFSFGILHFLGKGVSMQFVSWGFVLWLGFFYGEKILEYFTKITFFQLILFWATSIITIVLFLGGNFIQDFISIRTHDFIFPTIFLQFFLLVFIFCLTFLTRFFSQKISEPIVLLGNFSLEIYVLHIFLFQTVFFPLVGSEVYALLLSILGIVVLGLFYRKIFQ